MANQGAVVVMGQDEYDRLQSCLAECQKTQDFIDKCLQCGLAVQEEKDDNAEQIETINKLLKTFFPKGRPKK